MNPWPSFLKSEAILISLFLVSCPVWGCFPRSRFRSRGGQAVRAMKYRDREPPNTPELHAHASGPSRGIIYDNTPEYRALVHNYNDDIVFADEERTGEDRIMTRVAREKANNLAMLVQKHFGARTKLRITEAYDRGGTHAKDSLHYEGRALDITTDDRDRSKYGRLARLAVIAGFDYVFYESKSHIHVSVKHDEEQVNTLRGCFPDASTVQTPAGRKSMRHVAIGDRVLAIDRHSRQVRFSPVIAFAHRSSDVSEDYLHISTRHPSNHSFSVTPNHLVPRRETSELVKSREENVVNVFASQLRVGDQVLITLNDSVVFVEISSIRKTLNFGIHAPITADGTIVVDNFVASCYAGTLHEALAHLSLLPVRLGYILGLPKMEPTAEIHWYFRTLIYFAETVLRWSF